MNQHNDKKKISAIIRQYQALRKKEPDTHLDYCIKQKTLQDAIEVSARAINNQNKIHSHQRRIGRIKLNEFAELVLQNAIEIKLAKSFEQLLNTIKNIECPGIGELTYYDTATRIGAYMNIFPDKVYLHAGTRAGAKALLNDLTNKEFIEIKELPVEFSQAGLTASEIEDILCIFKRNF